MPKASGSKQYDTPTKCRVKGAVDYLEARHIPHFKSDVFRFHGVTNRQGWAIISEGSVDRRHHNADGPERRGRPSLLSAKDIREMDRIIQEEGFEARALSWEALGWEVGLEGISGRTIKRALGSMSYHKCVACRKGWVNKSTAEARKSFCEAQLAMRPTPEDWHIVRFSDEVHFALGPQGRLYIIRKPGERYCSDCIQYQNDPTEEEKELNKIHAWAAIGHDFKSPIVFYDISTNRNGKMTQKAYIDQILEPYVKPWIDSGRRFILEEDGDSGHGPKGNNIVKRWKETHGLQYYFNCHSSPDLAPIENAWQPPKQYVKKYPHWDSEDTKSLALEGWALVSQDFINERVDSMPKRLRDCIEKEGQMTAY